jgi:pimeloyl-ACP methyl ester carboxylesterase
MPSILDIVLRTPLWVWPLLILVLWLGWSGRRTRILYPARLAILPLIGLGTSFAGIVQSAAPPLAAIGWLIGLLAALPIGHAIGRRRAVRRLEGGRIEIAGGWFMLTFAVSIFAARYALGVLFGIAPALKAMPLWIVLSGGVGGVIAGIGLGWLAGLLVRRLPVARVAAAGLFAVGAGFAAAIAFSAPGPLPRLAAGDSLPGIEKWDFSKLPEVRRVAARDGAPLIYRLYPGRADRVVVLVHGSSGTSLSMHGSAQALQAAGATVYAISLRGHGGSGTTNGDTSYLSQLDDDLADLVKAVGLDDPKVHRTLIGFSSGGGFVLRIASGRQRGLFDAYLAVSPYVAHDAPTMRPNAGRWASAAVPRVIALSLLDAVGLPWFQDLPVVRFATAAAASDSRTPVYSFRLQGGMQISRPWRERLAGIDRPTAVIVGARDELFVADGFAPLFKELNPRIAVSVQPDLGHMDMITDPRGTAALAGTWRRLASLDTARRFDFRVREDMFAGFDGDAEAFARALALIDRTLAAEPDHAEALVWRGDSRVFLAGQAFQRGAVAEGMTLSRQGIADMMRAVALAPDDVAVRIPRATGLMPFARGIRPVDAAQADRLTRIALDDLAFALSTGDQRALGVHGRGELLGALADGWLQLGDRTKATPYLDRIVGELPNTAYAAAAARRRADPSATAALTCLGCH